MMDERKESESRSGAVSSGGAVNVKKKKMEHWKVIALYLVLYDVIVINASYALALWLRFDMQFSSIPAEYRAAFMTFAPFYTAFCIFVFYILRLYSSLWRFASFNELNRILFANVITAAFHAIGITAFFQQMPVSYYVFGAVVQFALVTVIRFSYRYVKLETAKRVTAESALHRAMVIGAGASGQIILRELHNSGEIATKPCCVIDDNSNKWGRLIEGIPIVGGRDMIIPSVEKYDIDQIFFAIPTASAKQRRDILNICKETGCELKSLPGLYQLANGEISLSKMRPVALEDLLGREQINVNLDEILMSLKGKVVLVTGGGGSIGSELCRQVAKHQPKQLIIFDIYENNAYDVEQELRAKYGSSLNLVVLIGSVRDSRRINSVFEKYHPDIVYHAAAHKHVPLMENNPNEAIKNNVLGTYKTALAALRNGTSRFVFISTDKAVNPTNIMGASKRLCEMVIQYMDAVSREGRVDMLPDISGHMEADSDKAFAKIDAIINSAGAGKIRVESVGNDKRTGTQFVAVRFGNVLGSNGSVIPLFKKQIEAGGPVTVTHPDIVRYFMTIPEAVSLVLQAGVYAWGGEIFVLDMGEPVKIDTLARNLIKLSGYEPGEDIEIVYSGLRPGEKLYEEKLMAEEGLKKTDNDLIYIGKPVPFDAEQFMQKLSRLAAACYGNSPEIADMVEDMVPTYNRAGQA